MGTGKTPKPSGSRPPAQWVSKVFEQLEIPLLTYTSRLLQNDAERSRDIVQDAFTKLCQQAWPDIEMRATAWLYRTCRNSAIDFFRSEGRMRNRTETSEMTTVADFVDRPPDQQAEQREQLDRLRSSVAQLPDRQQEILRLRLHDELSYKQIAEVMGLSVSNVGFLLHQAITALRAQVS